MPEPPADRNPPEPGNKPGPGAKPGPDIDAEFDRTLDLGLETAGEAWLDAIARGSRDPVVVMARIEEDGREKIDVRVGERGSLAEYLAGSYPEAAGRLREGGAPGLPMTVVVEYGGIIKIVNPPDRRDSGAGG
jgi:hypothetical protein